MVDDFFLYDKGWWWVKLKWDDESGNKIEMKSHHNIGKKDLIVL